jgi:ABC-type transport system involved in cytochrome c biogenesis ATPase subunit
MSAPVALAAGAAPARPSLPADATGFQHVVGGPLRGLTLPCVTALTILVDADEGGGALSPSAYALRLLAGIERPRAGKVLALGGDPAEHAALRRSIALLGDDVLIDRGSPLDEAASAVAAARGIATLMTPALVRAWLAEHASDLPADEQRRRVADAVAGPDQAQLLLVSHPERALDAASRDRQLGRVRDAVRRGQRTVVATGRLEDVLGVAEGLEAIGAVLHGGVLLVAGPAHGLPWAISSNGAQTRLIRVAVRDDRVAHGPDSSDAPPPAMRLAAELFADPEIAPVIVAIEPIGREELRLHVRDPQRVGRAIMARAKAGMAITRLVLHGSSAEEIAAAYGWARAQGARW